MPGDYDNQSRSMLQTDQLFPSVGSQKAGVVMNPDTSVDVRFGPSAPKGHDSNWVQAARTRVGAFSCVYGPTAAVVRQNLEARRV
jgi:hypothetical protein